jgi:hypothetical protein
MIYLLIVSCLSTDSGGSFDDLCMNDYTASLKFGASQAFMTLSISTMSS